jgi:hypothetical protein
LTVDEFSPDLGAKAILDTARWNWLLASGRESFEARATWSGKQLASIPRICLTRIEPNDPYQMRIAVATEEQRSTDWRNLETTLGEWVGEGQNILVDLTQLGFEALLYLLPAIKRLRPARLACIHIAPTTYEGDNTEFLQDMSQIGQPRGYVTLRQPRPTEQRRHILILGFDQWRPRKYIQKYDWGECSLHLLLGSPAYIEDGDALAKASCAPWFESFSSKFRAQVHKCPAMDPSCVEGFFARQLAECDAIDVVPLGPKPMLLGFLSFYLALSPEERERVRILYDFARARRARSEGVARVFLIHCTLPEL